MCFGSLIYEEEKTFKQIIQICWNSTVLGAIWYSQYEVRFCSTSQIAQVG